MRAEHRTAPLLFRHADVEQRCEHSLQPWHDVGHQVAMEFGDEVLDRLERRTGVFENLGLANNAPFAAAFAMVPLAIMAFYLVLMKRLGAFESL